MATVQRVATVEVVEPKEPLLMVSLIDIVSQVMATEISVEVKLTKQQLCHYKI